MMDEKYKQDIELSDFTEDERDKDIIQRRVNKW